jgi:chloramphenicol 3-O phosphotransferase
MGFNGSENRLLLLNGPSSAGKSTIAGELQKKLRLFNADPVIISIDDYMKIGTDEEIWEDDVFEIMPDMCRDITPALQQGKWVIVDHVITSERIFRQLKEMLYAYPLRTVHITCPPEILAERERARGDRCPGSAAASARYLYPRDGYDLTVDTGMKSARENALAIAETVFE